MADMIVGEKVRNMAGDVGTIVAVDERYIHIAYPGRTAKLQHDAFEKGYIRYENSHLQQDIAKAKQAEERKLRQQQEEREKAVAARRAVQAELSRTHFNVAVLAATHRLDPAPITMTPVRKKDKDLIRAIFDECDKETQTLFEAMKPEMFYPNFTSYGISKYCTGFITKHLDTYVFRVFSRNDDYKKTADRSVTIRLSDTTEVLRILRVNGKTYFFSKNLRYGGSGTLVNTKSQKNWHVSDLNNSLMVNEVIRTCDCGYLNDYIEEKQVDCLQYAKLMIPAFYNNKVEIVFKNKLFLPAYRIDDIEGYLEDYSSRQVDFASKNDVLNTLPVIKQYGISDVAVLKNMEQIMKKRRNGLCIYTALEGHLARLELECTDLGRRLLNFLGKISHFDVAVYYDYINLLAGQPNVTLQDFFDKDYVVRHDVLALERDIYIDPQDIEDYARAAAELRWIDREDNGYFIMVPKSISDFKNEGAQQNNCVFTLGYYRAVLDQSSIIVFLRKEKDKSFVTIEYDYENFEVHQARRKHNLPLSPALQEYVVKLGRQLHYERQSHD